LDAVRAGRAREAMLFYAVCQGFLHLGGHRLLQICKFVFTFYNMRRNDKWREFLLPRLRRGEISATQAALIADVTPQAVSRWCALAHIDLREASARHVLAVRQVAERWMSGVPRTSKAARREDWLNGSGLEQEQAPAAGTPVTQRRDR